MGFAVCGLLVLSAAAVVGGWFAFPQLILPRPPVGVLSLGDVIVIIAAVLLLPFLYLRLPLPLVAGLFLLASASALHTLLAAVPNQRWAAWPITAALLGADVASALLLGPTHRVFVAINDSILVLLIISVTVLWVQSGLRAYDTAVLVAAVSVYDFIATGLFPLTDELIERLASIPLAPLISWGTGENAQRMSLGLGDVLLATLFPLAQRKAFGWMAGLIALGICLGTVAMLLALSALGVLSSSVPAMVALGPPMVIQYIAWRRLREERTTWQYLRGSTG